MNEAIEVELSDQGKNLYVFFGGIAAGIVVPPFEFYSASRILDENKIFVRDFSQCWYQDGVPSVAEDVFALAKKIEGEVEKIGPEKLYFVGNSMGGYAAILFSVLVGKGEVIAFAPQTFISPAMRFLHGDRRWASQISSVYRKGAYKSGVWDLRALLERSGRGGKISIFVSRSHRLDRVHALNVSGIRGVRVYEFDEGGHNVVKLLRDEGKLPDIMSGTYVEADGEATTKSE